MLGAIDIGGSSVKMAIANSNANRFLWRSDNVEVKPYTVRNFLSVVKTQFEVLSRKFPLSAVGVGAPGQCTKTHLIFAPNLGWKNVPLKQLLTKTLGVPVTIANDADCFVMGEKLKGCAKSFKNVLGLAVGTGLGGGFVYNNHLVTSSQGIGFEPGWFYIVDDIHELEAKPVEYYIQKDSIPRIYYSLLNKPIEDEPIGLKKLCSMAENGDKTALKTFNIYGRYLGVALASYGNIYQPDCIIVGGGVSYAKPWFEHEMRLAANKFMLPVVKKHLKIKFSKLVNAANLWGCINLAYQYIQEIALTEVEQISAKI